MNKAELIEAITLKTETTKAQTAAMLDALTATIQEALTRQDTVQLVGFGTFAVAERAGREGRNPATGDTISIPAKRVVKFKVGKVMADAVAGAKAVKASKTDKPQKADKKK